MKFVALCLHSSEPARAYMKTAADTEKDYQLGCPWAFHKDPLQYHPAGAGQECQAEA